MPNRTICEVLGEMRSTYETRNFAGLLGLIEEAQSMANKMEAALQDGKSINELREERKELKDEVKLLEASVLKLERAKETLVDKLLMTEEDD